MNNLRLFYLPFPGWWQLVCDQCDTTEHFHHEVVAREAKASHIHTTQEVTR